MKQDFLVHFNCTLPNRVLNVNACFKQRNMKHFGNTLKDLIIYFKYPVPNRVLNVSAYFKQHDMKYF